MRRVQKRSCTQNAKKVIPINIRYDIIVKIAVVTVLVLVLCLPLYWYWENSRNKITEGVVIDKDYHSAYTTITYIHSDDMTIPVSQYYPERFVLTIRGSKNGATVDYWFEVSEAEYEKYSIGDYYKT